MNVEYLPSFLRDLKALKSTPVFEAIPQSTGLGEISRLKKLKGFDDAYRIRVGDYRVGLFITGETITFARVLHRKEIYRYFP
ncbi:MAG: type II toxin-antitoxin system RelE/ParE family toxin [Myxacorys californica WJT36-NPBG1]|nr:type II toxin-antitoxin system RelE/ParE family toxin [Myxacorys californica WJT36-NPBG1]